MDRRHVLRHGFLAAGALVGGAAASGLAKSKVKKKPKKKVVTQVFASDLPITINDQAKAAPYPATLQVSGLKEGVIKDVNLTLRNLSHQHTKDIDLMLVAPDGTAAILLSETGVDKAKNITLTLDDQAQFKIGQFVDLQGGAFQPNNVQNGDTFPAPAPQNVAAESLAVFNGRNPNGAWKLFIRDDTFENTGTLADGWKLEITAKVKI